MKFNTIENETKQRSNLLKASGIDTEGFGLLNTFFLSDEILSKFNWLSKKLNGLGALKLAIYFSNITTYQYKYKGFEIRQEISIKNEKGKYTLDGYVHDNCPDTARDYIAKKYRLWLQI